ncbi:MAG: serine/threonine protein kinase, partial [Polyangiales bacterium]
MLLERGRVFARDYRVVRPLSEGAMGKLYVVEQISTGAERALKLLNGDLLADPRMRERFALEARVGSRIESEHVVQVLASGVDEETALPFLVMELLRGQDLASLVEQRGALPRAEVTLIVEQLSHAVQ